MMAKSKAFKPSLLAIAVFTGLSLSSGALAQDTSSSMRGKVVTDTGTVVSDATVTVVHVATGRKATAQVNDAGVFVIQGLRVGGPYTIEVDSDAYADESVTDVYLSQGANTNFDFSLNSGAAASATTFEEVVVTGSRINHQTGRDFNSNDIAKVASIGRDIRDTLKRNPLAVLDGDEFSVAGANPRYNSFVVDGVRQNDNFGLNDNGYPTQRSPISLDAVESVSLNVAPFSVTQGGFTGGQINIVTKSGTNEVEGTVFYEFTDDGMAGDKVDGENYDGLVSEETTWGASVGFPIIQDKLFGFVSYEKFDKPVNPEYGPAGSGLANDSFVSQADWDRVDSVASQVYGLAGIGAYDTNPVEEDEKLLVKLDWQINDDHRLATTYQNTTGNRTNLMSSSPYSLNASSYWYDKSEELETFVAIVNSDWTDDFSTELKYGYKDTTTGQNPFYDLGIGEVSVRTASGTINFGVDEYRQANRLDNQTTEILAKGSYLMGDHEIVFGYNYETVDVFNLFVPASRGIWEFDSIDDFENGVVGEFSYTNAASGMAEDAGAEFEMTTHTFFIEDRWDISEDLDITYGIRYETVSMPDEPKMNQNFSDRYGFSNSESFDGHSMFLPRVGFNYQLKENIMISGGVGKFSGGFPLVWMSNSYSNDGISALTYFGGWDPMWNLDFGQVPQEATDALVGGDGLVNALDPNFDIPSDWRYNLRAETFWSLPLLGDDVEIAAEIIHKQNENDVRWVDLSRRQIGTDGTGRVVYETHDPLTGTTTDRYDLMLTNALEDGDSTVFTLSLANEWDNGWSIYTAYTYQDMTEGTQGSSSTARSNFQYPHVQYDRNGTTLGPGYWQSEHRFTMSLNWDREFFAGYETSVNMFYENRSGKPFSWVLGSYYDGNLGDQSRLSGSDVYLPYIPVDANDPNVAYGYGLDYDTFMAAVNEIGLGGNAGSIVGKGNDTQPGYDSLDINISQEIPGFSKEHKGKVTLSFVNVLNMLNDEWGVYKTQSFNTKILVDHDYDAATGVYTYSVPYGQSGLETSNYDRVSAERSVWQLKLGVRYSF